MGLTSRTLLCNIASRLTSFFNWNFPLRVEPVGLKRWLLQKKDIPWSDAIDGNKILEICPELSSEDLAALIEKQIKNENAGIASSFGRPYALLERNTRESGDALSVTVALPVTSTPHVIYRFGVKEFDFSKVYFECADVQQYLEAYTSKSGLKNGSKKTGSKRGPRFNNAHWEQTIENCTQLLVALYEGTQAPLTKAEAESKTANTQAFEAWWKNVPDKFKSGVKGARKKALANTALS